MIEADEQIILSAFNAARTEVEYRENVHEAIELGQSIMVRLGPNKSLFLKYENCIIRANTICLEKAYQLGRE